MEPLRATQGIKSFQQFRQKPSVDNQEEASQQPSGRNTKGKSSQSTNLKQQGSKSRRARQSPIILIEPQDYYIKVLQIPYSLSSPHQPQPESQPQNAQRYDDKPLILQNQSKNRDKFTLQKDNALSQQPIQKSQANSRVVKTPRQIKKEPILKTSDVQSSDQQSVHSSFSPQHQSSSSYSIPNRNNSFNTNKVAKSRKASESKDKRRRRLPVQMLLAYKNEVLKSFLKDVPFVRKKLRAKPSKGPPLSREQEWKKEYEVHKTLIKTIQNDIQQKKKLMQQVCQYGQYKQKQFNLRYGIQLQAESIFSRSSSQSSFSSSFSSDQSRSRQYPKSKASKRPKNTKNLIQSREQDDNSDEDRVNARDLCTTYQKRSLQLKQVVTQSFPVLQEMSRFCNNRGQLQEQASESQQQPNRVTTQPKTMYHLLKLHNRHMGYAKETSNVKLQDVSQNDSQIRQQPAQEHHQQLKLADSLSNQQQQSHYQHQAQKRHPQAKENIQAEIIKQKQAKLSVKSNIVSFTSPPEIKLQQQVKIAQTAKQVMRAEIREEIKQEKRRSVAMQRRIIAESMLFRVVKDTETSCNPAYPPHINYNPFMHQYPLTDRDIFKFHRKTVHQSSESSDQDQYREFKKFKKFRRMRKYKPPRIISYEQSQQSELQDVGNDFVKRKIRRLAHPYSVKGCKRQHHSLQQTDEKQEAAIVRPSKKKMRKAVHRMQFQDK